MNDELKNELKNVFDKYTSLVDSESNTDSKIRQITNKLNATSKYSEQFKDELLDVSNKHIAKHNIDDNSEIISLIDEHVSNFTTYGLKSKK